MGRELHLEIESSGDSQPRGDGATSVAASPRSGVRAWAGRAALIMLPALALVVAGCWWALVQWYSVFEHTKAPHYALQSLEGQFDNPVLRQTLGIFIALSAVYAIVLVALGRTGKPARTALVAVLVIALAMGVGSVLLYPVGALDVFNYMVELKLTWHHGENPYMTTYAAYREDVYGLHAFLVDVRLFYGPAWVVSSWLPVAITGFTDLVHTLLGIKIFHLALAALVSGLIGWHLRGSRHQWLAVAAFVANPLVMFEGVANAHNDILLTVFLVGAVIALERRSPLAGPLLALSALVKVYSGVLLPLFIVVALRDRWGWKRIGATVGLTAVVVAIVCAPFWADGKLVGGLLDGLEESQGMDHVSPFSLAQQWEQQQIANNDWRPEFIMSRPAHEILPEETQEMLRNRFTAVMVIGTLGLAISAWRGRASATVAAETLLVMFLTSTNLYPWYLIPVVALFALRPDRVSMWYVAGATALGLAYYPMFVYAHFNTGWSRFEVHQFLAIFLTVPILLYLVARPLAGAGAVLARRRTSV